MKRFTLSVFAATAVFLGVGAIVEHTSAGYRSDEKAVALIQKARVAIGGDAAINGIKNMRIVGSSTRSIKLNGVDTPQTGEAEISMMLPDRMMRTMKFGDGKFAADTVMITRTADVEKGRTFRLDVDAEGAPDGGKVRRIVIKRPDGSEQVYTGVEAEKIAAEQSVSGEPAKIIIKRDKAGSGASTDVQRVTLVTDDAAESSSDNSAGSVLSARSDDGKNMIFARTLSAPVSDGMRQNELLHTTLGLLLTPPQGVDIAYTLGGEGEIDGVTCNIVIATAGGQTFKLYLDHSSDMPVAISYTGIKMPPFITTDKLDGTQTDEAKEIRVFQRVQTADPVEFTVKFADYRTTNGVQLPYKWTTTTNGIIDETFDVTSYDINSPIVEKAFAEKRFMIVKDRTPTN